MNLFVGIFKVHFGTLAKYTNRYMSQDVDGELAQHLKRLGRKDPITKVNINGFPFHFSLS